jgi:integrase
MGKINKTEIDKLLGKPQSKQKEITDGNNLYLIVTKIGSCKFKYRIRTNSKASWIALGDYPAMTLNEARQQALQIKSMINNGTDPLQHYQNTRIKKITLQELAQRYITERLPIVRKKESSANHFIKKLEANILPVIGKLCVTEIDDNIIRNKLIAPKLDTGKNASAMQIRDFIKVLLDYAIDLGIISSNPVNKIKSYNIASIEPRSRYLNDAEIAQLLQTLYSSSSIKTLYKIAIHLLLMLLTRKIELVHAKWEQVDFEKSTFTITTSKMGTQLVIPLPTQAIALFRILQELSPQKILSNDGVLQGSDYIFVVNSQNIPLNQYTLNQHSSTINHIMFGNNKDQYFTIHDLRRTGATHLGEMGYPSDYIEMALNHTKSGIKQVYQRSQYMEQRKEMLQKWADRLDTLVGDVELLPYGKKFVI